MAYPSREEGFVLDSDRSLKLAPEILVIDIVVILHFGGLDGGAEQPGQRSAEGLFQIGEAALHVCAE